MFDNTRDRAQQIGQTRRILNSAEVGIDNPVAAIGDKNVAISAFSQLHFPRNSAFYK